jgi:NAD(P)-dependent dehydrogenase (short-subunit alcohol dehydrogenase family)
VGTRRHHCQRRRPGFFRTHSEAILDRHADAITASTPMARIGQEGELKSAVVFLASRPPRITGRSRRRRRHHL